MKNVVLVLGNMLWLYVTGFNGFWFSVIVTVIILITISPKKEDSHGKKT